MVYLDSMLTAFLVGIGASVAYMTAVFAWAHQHKRYDILNVVWGLACAAIAAATFVAHGHDSLIGVQALVMVLVAIWGVRLYVHLHRAWLRHHTEDKRFVRLRKDYVHKKGGVAWNMYTRVYLVQALWALIVSVPIIIVMGSEAVVYGWWAVVGTVVWLVGFGFEAIGDHQLRLFRTDPANKGKIMMSGLWKYTRHPNYFGEIAQWWGIFVIAWSVPFGWAGFIGPLVVTWLLVFSGIPVREREFRRRKGWEEYRRRTSRLLPLLPRD